MGMCNPGPDADLEALLTEQDRTPANSSATTTPEGILNEREHHHRNLRERRR